jgi:hypothetical protein
MRGAGSALFVSILLLIAGVLNVIYGIGAVSDAHFYGKEATTIIFTDLNQYGWMVLILGAIQILAGLSLLSGQLFGRIVGMVAAGLGAIGALMAVGGAYPFWSLGVFAICLIVIHGLAVYGQEEVR